MPDQYHTLALCGLRQICPYCKEVLDSEGRAVKVTCRCGVTSVKGNLVYVNKIGGNIVTG